MSAARLVVYSRCRLARQAAHPWLDIPHRSRLLPPRLHRLELGWELVWELRRAQRAACAAAAGRITADGFRDTEEGAERGLGTLLHPLSDPKANAKLLALCAAQMLASVATLLHDTYLPLYLSEVLHLSNTKMGNLHALLQFLAKASGIVSGRLADLLSPARMVVLGTLLTALCKPMFGLVGVVHAVLGTTPCVTWIAATKILDRAFKGTREAPSKVLIGDLAAQSGESSAAAFSLRQATSTLGMLVGATAASLAFNLSGRNYVLTFALSAIPAALALLLVASALGGGGGRGKVGPAPAGATGGEEPVSSLDGEDSIKLGLLGKARAFLCALRPPFWQTLATVCLLYTARFDVSFITLHAKTVMDVASLPILTPFMMAPVVLLAAPMGLRARASTKARNTVVQLGIAMLILGNMSFMLIPSMQGCLLGSACIGVHMAMTQGVTLGMLASYIPSHPIPGLGKISGVAWSFTDLLLGFSLACSNTLAGRLCDVTARQGAGYTGCFIGGSVACTLSMLALALFSTLGDLGKDDLLHAPQPGLHERMHGVHSGVKSTSRLPH